MDEILDLTVYQISGLDYMWSSCTGVNYSIKKQFSTLSGHAIGESQNFVISLFCFVLFVDEKLFLGFNHLMRLQVSMIATSYHGATGSIIKAHRLSFFAQLFKNCRFHITHDR